MKAMIVGAMLLAVLAINGCGSLEYTGQIGGPSVAQGAALRPTFRF